MSLKEILFQITNIKRLLNRKYQEERRIIFYSESSIYYLYFEGIIQYLLSNSKYDICYITSDIKDSVFKLASDRFKVLYLSNLMLAFVTIFLDSKVLVMTMTDLEKYHIKRSIKDVDHIYAFHAIMSTNMAYQKGAFDHYDTIFCVGPHHFEEIRQTECHYGLKAKRLVKVGYHLLERIYAEHIEYRQNNKDNLKGKQTILIAPSWSEGNIMKTCINELLSSLLRSGYRVILRPHPETYKRNFGLIKATVNKFKGDANFELEAKLNSIKNFHLADLLITDWSGIAFEYAFGTERPVLFINTPMKVHNSEYKSIGFEPLEVKLRDKIGVSLELDKINSIIPSVVKLLADQEFYRKQIIKNRDQYIYNWGSSSEVGGKYILGKIVD
jgi:YidC/Oxa1 family membrane protein insertase